jgi:hypothetical protein
MTDTIADKIDDDAQAKTVTFDVTVSGTSMTLKDNDTGNTITLTENGTSSGTGAETIEIDFDPTLSASAVCTLQFNITNNDWTFANTPFTDANGSDKPASDTCTRNSTGTQATIAVTNVAGALSWQFNIVVNDSSGNSHSFDPRIRSRRG